MVDLGIAFNQCQRQIFGQKNHRAKVLLYDRKNQCIRVILGEIRAFGPIYTVCIKKLYPFEI